MWGSSEVPRESQGPDKSQSACDLPTYDSLNVPYGAMGRGYEPPKQGYFPSETPCCPNPWENQGQNPYLTEQNSRTSDLHYQDNRGDKNNAYLPSLFSSLQDPQERGGAPFSREQGIHQMTQVTRHDKHDATRRILYGPSTYNEKGWNEKQGPTNHFAYVQTDDYSLGNVPDPGCMQRAGAGTAIPHT